MKKRSMRSLAMTAVLLTASATSFSNAEEEPIWFSQSVYQIEGACKEYPIKNKELQNILGEPGDYKHIHPRLGALVDRLQSLPSFDMEIKAMIDGVVAEADKNKRKILMHYKYMNRNTARSTSEIPVRSAREYLFLQYKSQLDQLQSQSDYVTKNSIDRILAELPEIWRTIHLVNRRGEHIERVVSAESIRRTCFDFWQTRGLKSISEIETIKLPSFNEAPSREPSKDAEAAEAHQEAEQSENWWDN